MASASPLLDINNFSLNYGAVAALRRISLSVSRGDIVGIVGESGCGKSSLINAVLRLLPETARTQGGVYFEGVDLYALDDKKMRALRGTEISVVFQDPMRTHHPLMRIGKQMTDIQYREPLSPAQKIKRAEAMLRQVEIPDPGKRLHDYPHQFSGGMLQRIAIAMALLSRPQLLIADEATTALDATLEVRVIEILQQLQQDIGCAILFISHHLHAVRSLCRYVAVMYAGELVEYGATEDIFTDPQHPYTRSLLQCDPGNASERLRHLPTIPGEVPNLAALPPGCAFADRCSEAMAQCRAAPPPLISDDKRQVRCLLHEKA